MLTYNSRLPRLTMPEYGRNIQRMVDHCLTLEDRDERTRCAYTIVDTMATLFPALKSSEDFRRKLWDHLDVISGHRLDIDWPVEPARPEDADSRPERVAIPRRAPGRRNYGQLIRQMVRKAVEMAEGPERDALILLLANQMKKIQISADPGMAANIDDVRIFSDLYDLSDGALNLDPDYWHLCEYQTMPAPAKARRNRRR